MFDALVAYAVEVFPIGVMNVFSGRVVGMLALGFCAGWMPQRAAAQQDVREVFLADVAQPAQVAAAAGSVSGTVTDADGKLVPKAKVALSAAGKPPREVVSDEAGAFRFEHVPAESFTLTVSAPGFGTATVSGVEQEGQAYDAQEIALRAAAEAQIDAITREQLAEIEVKQEETQRLLGAVPNFFVTYDWHAPPLTTKQKYRLAWRTSIDPANTIIDGAVAGINQATNALPGYGQGAAGYGKRFGAAEGDLFVGTFIGGAVVPSLLHQDPRFYYKADGTIMQRALYAISTAVICKGDNGKWQPNYSSVIGDIAAGAATNLYYPATNRNSVAVTFQNGLLDVGLDGVGNLIQEFVYAKLTYRKGKRQGTGNSD